jgi:hypothetical protein
MRLNQVASQLKIAPAKIQEAIAALHQRRHPAFPSSTVADLSEVQVEAIAQYLRNPQQEQSTGAQPGSAHDVGGAFGVISQQFNEAAATAGVQIAREAVRTAQATATHLLVNYSPDEIDDLALRQLGLGAIEDNGASQGMASVLSSLGKPRRAMLDFTPNHSNPILSLAGVCPPTQQALSASSDNATAEAGSDS